jgi:hypothetical protein
MPKPDPFINWMIAGLVILFIVLAVVNMLH